jgi:hypothetical protein
VSGRESHVVLIGGIVDQRRAADPETPRQSVGAREQRPFDAHRDDLRGLSQLLGLHPQVLRDQARLPLHRVCLRCYFGTGGGPSGMNGW